MLAAALLLPALAAAQIRGAVRDAATGRALGGATVRAVPVVGGDGRAGRAGADGAFAFDGLGPGAYVVRATRVGYAPAEAPVVVAADGTAPAVALGLDPRPIELGTVLAEADRPRSAASSETVRAFDLLTRPTRSSQDLLRLVPGVVIAQHAGGGKAEQIFLRGFDADHGTDVAVSVDGVPVNMVSHGHGQGYADLHFLIPDVVERIEVNKGPYRAEDGNLATAGAVGFATRDRLDGNLVRVGAGAFRSADATALVGLPVGGATDAYAAAQFTRSDGPFEAPQEFHRANLFGKVTRGLGGGGLLRFTASAFTSAWDASGQVPDRAVRSGLISRFGAIDAGEGGATSREDLNLQIASSISGEGLDVQAYATRYRFKLFSNFTFFLDDPAAGDMIEQTDRRTVVGVNARYRRPHRLGSAFGRAALGASTRADAAAVTLWKSPDRVRAAPFVDSRVEERNVALWAEEDLVVGPALRVIGGLRADYFTFDVDDALDGVDDGRAHASGTAQDVRFSPKASVILSPARTLDVFVNAGAGFHSNDARAVVVADRLRRCTACDVEGPLRTLPRALGGEVGVRGRFGPANVAAALWRLDLDEELVYVGDAGTTEPSGRSRRVGLDLEGRLALAAWLAADADLTLSRGRLPDEPAGADRIPLAPTLTAAGGLTARHPSGLSGSLRLLHVGDRPANEDASVTALGYTLVTAGAAYRFGPAEVSATLENAFDVAWNEAQFDTESRLRGEATSISELHFTPGNPRNVRVALAYRF